jgi:hypothetical protein
MVFAEPMTASSVLSAYPAGLPVRVIAREHGFARVQDLGSGQFGWVKEASLAPFSGGARQREEPVLVPQVVASVAPVEAAPEAPQAAAPKPVPAKVAVSAKKAKPPRSPAPVVSVATAKAEPAAAEPGQRGFFGFRRAQPQRVALGGNQAGFAGMINRAFGGR